MKAADRTRQWVAAGVRHELLMRALPAVRHDLAAPLSLMRMQLLMLRRQAAAEAPPVPADALAPRVALFESQVSELSQGLRNLRDWELPLAGAEPRADAGLTRAALVRQCVALMRAGFDMDGITLQIDAALDEGRDVLAPANGDAGDQPPGEAPVWPDAVGLRYLLLGALCFLHDTHPALAQAGTLHVSPEGDAGLRLSAEARSAEGDEAATLRADFYRAPRDLLLDADSLQALAAELGHAVTITPQAVTLDLRRA